MCTHGRNICSTCIVPDDAAKRAYEITQMIVAHVDYDSRVRAFPWIAIRLSDGGTDGNCYETKRIAVQHQLHEQLAAYFCFREAPNGFSTPKDAAIYLAFNRQAYDNGMRLADSDDKSGGPSLIMPSADEHLRNQLGRLGRK